MQSAKYFNKGKQTYSLSGNEKEKVKKKYIYDEKKTPNTLGTSRTRRQRLLTSKPENGN